MKKLIAVYIALATLLIGCQQENTISEPFIYFVDANGTDLVPVAYDGDLTDGKTSIDAMLEALESPEESVLGYSPFTKNVKVTSIELNETDLMLSFNLAYLQLTPVEEVLLRASLVQSLVKIEGVETVTFYAEEEPLKDVDGNIKGAMRADDFVQNVGSAINSYQTKELTLYFADQSGAKLVKETRNARYNSNTAMEKVVIERIMNGTSEESLQSVIAPGTKLLGVTVKEDICYVNFDDGIQQVVENITPEVLLYSIVNSVVENDIANQVQISINGESAGKLLGSISLEKPFEANWELVQDN